MLRSLSLMDTVLSFKTKILVTLSLTSFLERRKELPLPYWFLSSCFFDHADAVIINTLAKLEAEDCILRSFIGKSKYISLINKGVERLNSKINFIHFLREKWDGSFRMVLFDIPEPDRKIRDHLRTVLYEQGFVCWQKSVFISPRHESKVLEETKKLGISKEVNILLVNSPIGVNTEQWVWNLWNLWEINNGYNFFINQAKELLEEKIDNYKKWVIECQSLRFKYYGMLQKEPFLPEELVGENYLLWKAEECYGLLGKKLLKVLERV